MIINPEKMVFENTIDIADYVSRGLPPTRKNFEKLIIKIRKPDTEEPAKPGELYISDRLFINCDNDTMDKTLTRVYENRIHNRNLTIGGVIGLIIAGIFIGGVSRKNSKNEETDTINDNDFDSFDMNLLD